MSPPLATPDFRLLFDSSLSPLLVLSPDFTIVEVNRAYLAATRTERTIVGQRIFDVFPDNPDDPSADGVANLRRSLESVVATGRKDTMALQRYDIPTGEAGGFAERYWSPVNSPVLDAEGRVTHIIHRVEDVTDFVHLRRVGREQERAAAEAQMRAEGMEIDLFVRAREIREVNEQLSRANAELDAAGQQLREEQKAKDRFIATLSHELRNPLAAACAAVELLALDLPDGGRPALSVLERQLGTLVRMSNDLLDGTRALTGRLELVSERVDVRSVVEGACADIRSLFGHEERTLQLTLPDTPVVVDGDRLRLAQVLTNLLSNALKYTPPGGRTEVRLTVEDEQARLTVRDDGIGFQPAQAEDLFGVFVRAAPAGPNTPEGLGLGLAVARTVVELHGGRIGAHSEGPGRGATFTVLLPRADDKTPEPVRPSAPPRSRRRLAILIVEDNADLAATYRTLLERQGHQVTAVHTGADALTATESDVFDVVLCDLGLPDTDGYTVARTVRSRPHGDRPRLIAVSGFSRGTDRSLSRTAGFDAHLAKPLPLTDLLDLLERLE
ncbi:ATP-binding protein [Streptomyces sp. MBT62]|uniref:hybrid sensor histidine kinase/response regulator n=1 Tax=Streptomyces sp. MBT62 TaxID=2800410 RepID=UPI00190C6BA8|nr:ATP-binding protein [Streptomyces sp. MBT62]MBK3566398.1 response regulator [Streptomyces sp. MBT62]